MAIKILVVDDEPDVEFMIKQQFEDKIEHGDLSFVFANDGNDALQKLKDNPDVEVIFSDINMPGMDGLTLLANSTKINPHIKTVIVSAYGDFENIRKAMNRGAFDFLTKPLDFEDWETTLTKTLTASNEVKQAAIEHDYLTKLKKELDVARNIQEAFIPNTFNPLPNKKNFELFGKVIPALFVGGDFLDFFPISENKLALVLGDVCGKGVSGALFMATVRACIRCFSTNNQKLSDCVEQVNNFLCVENDENMFVTLFYGILDLDTGLLTYCNCGHNFPYIVSENGEIQLIKSKKVLALGLFPEFKFEDQSIQLKKNDLIFIYSDGVTEAMNISDQLYTDDRAQKTVITNSKKPLTDMVSSVIDDIHDHVKNAEQSDDITILTLRYLG